MSPRRLFGAGLIACALFTAAVPAAAERSKPAASAPFAFRSDRIGVQVVGQGPDVVLIPGLATSPAVWSRQVERLSMTHRLHLVWISGFAGRPAEVKDGPVFAPVVAEIARYIRDAGLRRPAVIGHSLGGEAALKLAEDAPELVGRVMVIDAVPFLGGMGDPNATPESAAPLAERMAAGVLGMSDDAFAKGQAASAPFFSKTPARQAEIVRESVASDRGTMARAMRDLVVTDLRPGLKALRVPVTVLYAWDEAMRAPPSAIDAVYQRLYADLPGVKLVRIDGAFHFLMDDRPERFDAELDAFLS